MLREVKPPYRALQDICLSGLILHDHLPSFSGGDGVPLLTAMFG